MHSFINTLFIIIYILTLQSKTGGLPNISFVARKPKPLGTEFKVVVDGISGIMLAMDLCEGEEAMRAKDNTGELGVTGATTLRLVRDHIMHCRRK